MTETVRVWRLTPDGVPHPIAGGHCEPSPVPPDEREEAVAMGTNFYLHTKACECCGRYDTVHIGKRSMGWSFSWQGFRDEAWPGQYKLADEPLSTAEQWTATLRTVGGRIEDEYGTEHAVDDFLTMVADVNERASHTVGDRDVSGPYWKPYDPDRVEQPDRSTVSFYDFT